MYFLDITSLGMAYGYAVKIEKKLSRRDKSLDLQTPHSRSREKAAPTHTARDREKMASLKTTNPSRITRREMRRQRRTRGNGVSTIKSLVTTLKNIATSSHSWSR
jgi:hypothetical protein